MPNKPTGLFAAALGKRLKQARTDRCITVPQLSDLIGTDKRNIWAWEAARMTPQAVAIPRLCDALQVTADWLLRGDAA